LLRLAFFGLPLAALLLRADGHDLVYAGICRKEAPGTRRLLRAFGPERVAIMPRLGDRRVVDAVRAARPDLLVSWFWTKKIPEAILGVAPLGTVGVHPSLLPRHRGPDPCFWTIREGDRVAGVTAHRLEREYDTGAILGQRSIEVDAAWNAWTLAKQLDRPSLALLRETVSAFARGTPPAERAQERGNEQATFAPMPSDDDLELDVRREGAAALERLVRAAAPFPGAWLELGDDVVVVTEACVDASVPRALAPGEAAVVGERAVVRTSDTGLALLRGRLVGDDGETELDAKGLAELVQRLSGRLSGGPALA
jgi:methionyl-tRNA formyltransferase